MTSLDDWKKILDVEEVSFPESKFELNKLSLYFSSINKRDNSISEELDFSNVQVGGDGFFRKNNYPVLAYIRRGRGRVEARAYHFTYCDVIKKLPASAFYCTNEYENGFLVDIEKPNGDLFISKTIDMPACILCVGEYYNLKGNANFDERVRKSKNISAREILAKAGDLFKPSIWKSKMYQHWDKPWSQISTEIRALASWCCVSCNRNFSQGRQKWLHVHHVNSDRNDNHINNLRPLCLGCHAEQPGHGKLKNNETYQQFLELYPEF
jgi:hypothetical protein